MDWYKNLARLPNRKLRLAPRKKSCLPDNGRIGSPGRGCATSSPDYISGRFSRPRYELS